MDACNSERRLVMGALTHTHVCAHRSRRLEHIPTSPVTWENVWLKDVSPGILAYTKRINSY